MPGTIRSTAVLTVTISALAIAAPLEARQVDLAAVGARIEAEATKIVDETGIPSLSIALVRDGAVAWTGAFGWANAAARVPATPETFYSTGSTFKFVTATAVMQLVDAGKLTLDTPLNEIVDAALTIDDADDVTLRHMLSHHSGLQGPVGTVPLWGRAAPRAVDSLLAHTRRVGPPGVEYRYCNECYAIAGHVVEKLSGEPWDEYVAQHILQPLGIDIERPSIPSPHVVERLALPYGMEGNEPVPLPQVRYDVFAAGDVYLRARDMAAFLAAQLGDGRYRDARILEEATAREMRRGQFGEREYGLGIGIGEQDGRATIAHSGAIPGFNTIMIGEPGSGFGVYIMANSGQAQRAIGAIARLALALLHGENPEPLPSFALREPVIADIDPTIVDAYTGRYRLNDDFIFTVTREGDRFFGQATGQERVEMFPESETTFFVRSVQAQLVFVRDESDGTVTHLILRQGGQEARLERIR